MKPSSIVYLVAAALCLAFRAHAAPVNLGYCTIDLPEGVIHHKEQGQETSVGSLVSTDGTPEVKYGIGLYGRVVDTPDDPKHYISAYGGFVRIPTKDEDYSFFRTGTVNGTPYFATIERSYPSDLTVLFPRCGVAIFSATVSTPEDTARVLKLLLHIMPNKP